MHTGDYRVGGGQRWRRFESEENNFIQYFREIETFTACMKTNLYFEDNALFSLSSPSIQFPPLGGYVPGCITLSLRDWAAHRLI